MSFIVVSRTIGVFLVEREPSHRSLWQANDIISPEQTFSVKSTQYESLKAYKELYDASFWTLRYTAASVVIDKHRTITVTLWSMHQGLITDVQIVTKEVLEFRKSQQRYLTTTCTIIPKAPYWSVRQSCTSGNT